MTYHPLIEKMGRKEEHVQAVLELIGAINARDLRTVTLSLEARTALTQGLTHPNAKIRWWCLQYMDHLADESFVPFMLPLTKDPVAKVRRQAIHALTCEVCKPDGCALDVDLKPMLETMLHDIDAKVRGEAQQALDRFARV